MYGPPQSQPQPIDINAALAGFLRRVPAGDLLIALCLLLLFSFSFVGGWFQASAAATANCTPSLTSVCAFTNDSLWHGFGILPALLIIAAMLFFVIRRLPRVRLALGVPEAVVWMGFAVLEIGLFFAYWVIGNGGALVDYCDSYVGSVGSSLGGSFNCNTITAPQYSHYYSLFPGWTLWVAMGLAILLGLAAYVQAYVQSAGATVRSTAHDPGPVTVMAAAGAGPAWQARCGQCQAVISGPGRFCPRCGAALQP